LKVLDRFIRYLGLAKKEAEYFQALVLYNIGDDQPSVGELVKRGYYLGTNATYNVHRMAESGYVTQERSTTDRRAFRVKLVDVRVSVNIRNGRGRKHRSARFARITPLLSGGQMREEQKRTHEQHCHQSGLP